MFGNLCMCSMRDRCAVFGVFLLSAFCCGTVNASEKQFAEAQDSTSNNATLPLVVGTWAHSDFQAAVQTAWSRLQKNSTESSGINDTLRRLNALVEGLSECEKRQCDRTVGFGGSPDENGETTLDALLMDGPSHRSGAVGALKRIKSAARVALAVYNYTEHSMLVGEGATQFAVKMGFKQERLDTLESRKMHDDWITRKCQPNFWRNVCPNPRLQCGPYTPNNAFASQSSKIAWLRLFDKTAASFADTTLFCPSNSNNQYFGEGTNSRNVIDETNHDTLGMIVIDEAGDISVGTSSNGARNKIPGRVGDSPIVGSGAYVDNEVGGAAATGDGDIMLRFSPSFLAVEQMRLGFSPNAAAEIAIGRIREKYSKFSGAVITANKRGEYGAACSGMEHFPFSIAQADFNNGTVFTRTVKCL